MAIIIIIVSQMSAEATYHLKFKFMDYTFSTLSYKL